MLNPALAKTWRRPEVLELFAEIPYCSCTVYLLRSAEHHFLDNLEIDTRPLLPVASPVYSPRRNPKFKRMLRKDCVYTQILQYVYFDPAFLCRAR